MGCLNQIIIIPIYLILTIIFIIPCILSIIFYLLCYPLKLIIKKLYNYYTNGSKSIDSFKVGKFCFEEEEFNTGIVNYKHNDNYKKEIENTDFDLEAKLWGLTNEEIKIAKEQRMSPEDFIEAEEYDDDELLKDEWER